MCQNFTFTKFCGYNLNHEANTSLVSQVSPGPDGVDPKHSKVAIQFSARKASPPASALSRPSPPFRIEKITGHPGVFFQQPVPLPTKTLTLSQGYGFSWVRVRVLTFNSDPTSNIFYKRYIIKFVQYYMTTKIIQVGAHMGHIWGARVGMRTC